MPGKSLVIIYSGLLFFCVFAFFIGYKRGRTVSVQRSMRRLGYFALPSAIVLNFILLGDMLYHSRFVPSEAKGGFYGSLASLSFGAVLLSVTILSAILGMAIRTDRSNGAIEAPSRQLEEKFPRWLTIIFNILLAVMTGGTIGTYVLMAVEKRAFDEVSSLLLGCATGISGMYIIAVSALLVQKYLLKKIRPAR
jgi:hypothetical protein